MSFDANEPRSESHQDSAPIRANFVALKALIDTIPAGPPGAAGADGQPGTDGSPGTNGADGRGIAEVYDSGDGRAMVRMTDGATYGPFTVASGPAGLQGERGSDGSQGIAGNDGAPGATGPAGNDGRSVTNVRDYGDGRAIVDMSDGSSYGPFSVASGPAGPQGDRGSDGGQGPAGNDGRSVVNVRDSGDGRAIVDMSDGSSYGPFTVAGGPQGPQGNNGVDGRSITNVRDNGDSTLTVEMSDGSAYGPFPMPAGPAGPQGQPGEVSAADLSFAFGATSANTNGVQLLGLTVSDPPTQSEMQAIANKMDELIAAMRR